VVVERGIFSVKVRWPDGSHFGAIFQPNVERSAPTVRCVLAGLTMGCAIAELPDDAHPTMGLAS
jgi:hypothetical protein